MRGHVMSSIKYYTCQTFQSFLQLKFYTVEPRYLELWREMKNSSS